MFFFLFFLEDFALKSTILTIVLNWPLEGARSKSWISVPSKALFKKRFVWQIHTFARKLILWFKKNCFRALKVC